MVRAQKTGLWNSLAIAGFAVSCVATLCAVIGTWVSLSTRVEHVQAGVAKLHADVESAALAAQFLVLSPANGASVGQDEPVRGSAPFHDRNYYLIVTPIKAPQDWVQPGRITISGRYWDGIARFGEPGVGIGDRFLVRALSTKAILPPGALTQPPADAVFSEPVAVTRAQ